jgi:hypothetical protein
VARRADRKQAATAARPSSTLTAENVSTSVEVTAKRPKGADNVPATSSVPHLASADKLHDFKAVAGRNLRLWPGGARQNFQIALDCHPRSIQTQFAQKANNRRAALRFAVFSVHRNRDLSSQRNTLRCGHARLGAQLKP